VHAEIERYVTLRDEEINGEIVIQLVQFPPKVLSLDLLVEILLNLYLWFYGEPWN